MNTVLITGANRGIGLALVKVYARRGDTVFACCRVPNKAEELRELAKAHDVRVMPLSVDSDSSVNELARQLSAETIDILINNAGVIAGPRERQTATNIDFAAWIEAFNINTMGPVRVMQALLPQLRRSSRPRTMNVTSQLGAISFDEPILYAYSATKAALNKFMRMAAIDLKQQGIAVGLVHPGWVQTDMGGEGAVVAPDVSAAGIVRVIDSLSLDNAGSFWQWDGSLHEW